MPKKKRIIQYKKVKELRERTGEAFGGWSISEEVESVIDRGNLI